MVYKEKIVKNRVIVHVYKDKMMGMLPDGFILTSKTTKGMDRKIKKWVKENIKDDESWLTTVDYMKID